MATLPARPDGRMTDDEPIHTDEMTTNDTTTPTLPTSELVNFRDLGGTPVADGAIVHGRLWRSDDVSLATSADAERLVAGGLADVLDLRSPHEAGVAGRGHLAAHPPRYHHLPMSATAAAPGMTPQAVSELTPRGVGTWYVQVAEQTAPQIIRGLEIAAQSSGAALFHCAAGKDRTGVFAAAVLGVLGADDDTIIADYARTDAVMPQIMRRIGPMMREVVRVHNAPLLDPAKGGALFAAPAESMATMLRVMRHDHGSILELLRSRGLTTSTIDALRARVVR